MRPPVICSLRALVSVSALACLLAGCAASGGSSSAASGGAGPRLPALLSSRWSAPDFATRIVDAERPAVIDAAVSSANGLGYAVNRIDGAFGKISAARRQASAFDGARQDTLEITVTTLSPGSTKVAVSLREAFESKGGDERSGGVVTTSLVRDRAPYDAFFARLAEALSPSVPASAPAP